MKNDQNADKYQDLVRQFEKLQKLYALEQENAKLLIERSKRVDEINTKLSQELNTLKFEKVRDERFFEQLYEQLIDKILDKVNKESAY